MIKILLFTYLKNEGNQSYVWLVDQDLCSELLFSKKSLVLDAVCSLRLLSWILGRWVSMLVLNNCKLFYPPPLFPMKSDLLFQNKL